MTKFPTFPINDQWILSKRTPKVSVDPLQPYGFFNEKERLNDGRIEEVTTILLSNSECTFRCLMCDLWKYTTYNKTPLGAIPTQIQLALKQLPKTKHIKLYNAGSFFDTKAIPKEDYQAICNLLRNYETVIVENHPKLLGNNCLKFSQLLNGKLEVALGLETVHPQVLLKLNKKTDLHEFKHAVSFLSQNNIASRAFILLRPPFLSEEEGIEWAKRSLDFVFDCGIQSCTVIPTRAGNGAMEVLEEQGYFSKPSLKSLHHVLNYGVNLKQGNVFADLWDIDIFSECNACLADIKAILKKTNYSQTVSSLPKCSCNI